MDDHPPRDLREWDLGNLRARRGASREISREPEAADVGLLRCEGAGHLVMASDSNDAMTPLERLFRAIADGDRALSSKLLAATPALATEAARFGATRQDESPILAAIGLHVYAGETALHVASAAHD